MRIVISGAVSSAMRPVNNDTSPIRHGGLLVLRKPSRPVLARRMRPDRLLLRGVHASGVKETVTVAAFFAACSTPAQPGQNDQVGQRDFLAPIGRCKRALDASRFEHLRQLQAGDFPVLLRCQANRRRSHRRLVEPRNVHAEAQAVETRSRQTDRSQISLREAMSWHQSLG